jgi:5-hydroxyisourate hydrolase
MSGISTHVLDTSKGQPAQGLRVTLERQSKVDWALVGEGVTDNHGRISQLLRNGDALEAAASYRLVFHTGDYFGSQESIYPEVAVQFLVRDASANYHLPLLLSPYGYTTYRGS